MMPITYPAVTENGYYMWHPNKSRCRTF
jgi:adenyl_thiF: thiazole biosynthesis adenylyltransferase ThiF